MKKLRKLSSIFLLLVLSFQACQPDETEEPAPTDERDKFVASWKCTEQSNQTGTNPAFNVHINKSTTNASQIVMENFYGMGFDKKPYAEVSGNSITIPTQIVSGNTIKGSGNLSGTSTINMNYTVNDGSTIDSVKATLTKN